MIRSTPQRIFILFSGLVFSFLLFTDAFTKLSLGIWLWKRDYQPTETPIQMRDYKLNSYKNGILISATSNTMRRESERFNKEAMTFSYEYVPEFNFFDEGSPQLLNLLLPDGKDKIVNMLKKSTGPKVSSALTSSQPNDISMTNLITNNNNELYISANLIGKVLSQDCDVQGHCILATQLWNKFGKTIFYSDDGGRHWRWINNWISPKNIYIDKFIILNPKQLFGQNAHQIYLTEDLGQSWQLIVDLAVLITNYNFGFNNQLQPANYYWNGTMLLLPNKEGNFTIWGEIYEIVTHEKYSVAIIFDPNKLIMLHIIRFDGSVKKVASSTQKEIYFTLSNQRHDTLNKLNTDGSYQTILETEKSALGQIWVGGNMVMVENNHSKYLQRFNYNKNKWQLMTPFGNRSHIVFDSERDRLYQFPSDYGYSTKIANTQRLAYQTLTITE